MKTVVYAGSFDPVTYGHLDIIKRACQLFGNVKVVIGSNPAKKYMLSLHVRYMLLKELTKDMGGVEVVPLGNRLLVDYCYENNILNIIKGVRNQQDFDYERLMHEVNTTQRKGIETIILNAKPELAHISSSAVKELAKHHGFIQDYVPLKVKQAVEYANGQIIIGITGTIASGKSTVTQEYCEYARSDRPIHIDLDKLAHELISTDTTPLAQHLRAEIRAEFKMPYFMPNDPIDRKLLGDKVFGNPEELAKLNALFREPLLFKIRQAMSVPKTARGVYQVYLLNGALLAEANLLFLCNNNIVITYAEEEVINARLKARGLHRDQISRRLLSQYHHFKKLEVIRNRIKSDRCGYITEVNTTDKVTWIPNMLNHWEVQSKTFYHENKDEVVRTPYEFSMFNK
jgi:pantetheine-phosphate adenylyltransferase